ncbi:hypothetical protein BCR44DRAFT_1480249 [Catenaria anguillulae PL171]|uniref:Cation-transporting P-type ATPase N-terminal domain-containing protein n=1 Tax=Catenaria anguillulae PL171 TaxID=765915 RepID=A0A1Y2HBP5_9FUNG|nr:hypothetical protein BCR44DRAFT_1480249 [Catenaria anguillulae PL171]
MTLPISRTISTTLSRFSIRKKSAPVATSAGKDAVEYYLLDVDGSSLTFRLVRVPPTYLTHGLSSDEAARRFAEYGPNQFGDHSGPSALKVLANSVFNSMNASTVLMVIIITNSYLSFRQEYKSERTMDALRKLTADTAAVYRDGELVQVEASELVPGDIVQLEEGDHVPADLRLFETINLQANEALLTGEPMAIRKVTDAIVEPSPLGDRKNLAFKSTVIAYGRGRGIVVGTGINTEIGKIAEAVQAGANKNTLTPLERTMRNFMLMCFVIAVGLGIVVFWVNNWRFDDTQVLLYAIATAVAILPEGLPAVTTVAMALGVSTMAKQKAIVRKLVSLEALGMVTNICSDKTGTLTEGRMSMVTAWLFGTDVKVSGSFNKEGSITGLAMETLRPFLELCGLCNTCSVTLNADTNMFEGAGDTTEIALAVVATRHGYTKDQLVGKSHQFFAEYPFDSNIKRMSVVFRELTLGKGHDLVMYTKGALESVLPRCVSYLASDGSTVLPMTQEYADITVQEKALSMATQGLRVLCVAMRRVPGPEATSDLLVQLQDADQRDANERDLVLIGLIGIQDPPREETPGAIAACHQAGIKVHMITGDHHATAAAIARQIGILPPSALPGTAAEKSLVMTSMQFDPLSEDELDALPNLPLVIARCSPETKVKMISALHRRGCYVAMTGDGVNDAPAIAFADVGIAMGQGGADVTKQASSITLTDDNFATIVSAIAQGRRIFANITKFTGHLLSGNVSEVVALIIGLVFHDGLGQPIFPMSAIQILWLNLVTSSPIALALAMEPASAKLMRVKPRAGGVFTKEFIADTGILGGFMGGLTLLVFCLVAFVHADVPLNQVIPLNGANCNKVYTDECDVAYRARGVGFVNLCMLLLVHGINCRFPRRSLFYYNWAEAKVLLWAIVLGAVMIVPLPYIPYVNHKVFYHTNFTYEWGYIAACMVVFMMFSELYKFIKRRVLPKERVLAVGHGMEYQVVADEVEVDAEDETETEVAAKSANATLV